MRVFGVLAILLGFLVLEIFTLVRLAEGVGWWLLLWLLCAALVGWWWLRNAGFAAVSGMLQAVQSGESLGVCIFYGAIPFITAILLIFPGVISDIIALLLLLLSPPTRRKTPPQEDGVIEGEWRKMDDRRDRLE